MVCLGLNYEIGQRLSLPILHDFFYCRYQWGLFALQFVADSILPKKRTAWRSTIVRVACCGSWVGSGVRFYWFSIGPRMRKRSKQTGHWQFGLHRANIARRKARYMMNIRCFQRSFLATSSPLVPVPLPSRMEAHFWYIIPDEVKDKRLMNQYLELLSPCEKESILRIQGEQQRKRAILARALVRTTIARYQTNYQLDPRSLRFGKNMYGKPKVTWQNDNDWHIPPLQFNISHTSSMVACGLTSHSPIGIDVEEKLRKLKNNILVFANRYFSPEEVRLLTAISDTEIQRQEFIKLWTLKESYVKAIGRGFSGAPFKTFTIQYRDVTKDVHPECIRSEVSNIIVKPSGDSENLTSNWHFSLMELAGSHYAAVCMEKDEAIGDEASDRMRLTVWRTVPLVEDEWVSGTDRVLPLGGAMELSASSSVQYLIVS